MKTESKLPAQLESQVAMSGLELTEAQSIASNYAPIFQEVAEQEAILKTLKLGNTEDAAKAKRIRINLGKICSKADAQKKIDKEKVLVRGRFIDGLFNAANGYGRLTQEIAKEHEDFEENLRKERIAKLQFERSEELAKYGGAEYPSLGEMTEDVWQNFLAGTKANYQAKIEAEAKAEADRIEAERLEKERIEAQAIENAKLKAEAEAREKEIAIERKKEEEARKLAEEKAAKERAEIEAKLKAEAEAKAKVEAELAAKLEAERKAESLKIAEQKAREEAEAKAAKAPIKKKVSVWVNSFELPSTDVDNPTTNLIKAKFDAFKKWAVEQTENI